MLSLALPPAIIDLQLPLLHLNTILALAIGPHNQILRFGITFPIFIVLVAQSTYREWSGTWGMHYAVECMVLTCVFTYVDWNILGSPDKEAWGKTRYGVGKENAKERVPRGFWKRAWWGVRLGVGSRYVGWSCEVKNVAKEVPADYSRWKFVARKVVRALVFYALRDTVYAYTAASPYGSWVDITHIKPIASFAGKPYLTRWSWAWVQIFLTYVALEQANAAYGAFSVATGLANPRDCPSAFGDLRGLVAVRKAWSSVWHQNCRRICSAPGIFIARDVLRLQKGSFASKYLQLFMSFGISGVVHGCSAMFVHGSFDDDAAFAFFLGQAAVIFVEDHVIDLGKRLGFRDSGFWRLVGFIWTILAVGAGTELWSTRAVAHGMWIHDRAFDIFGIGPQIVA